MLHLVALERGGDDVVVTQAAQPSRSKTFFPAATRGLLKCGFFRRLNGDDASGDSIENSATIKGTVTTLSSTKPPSTPAPQDAFESVADPTTTVTQFAPIGHENNGSLF